jgi:hypothetical protein
VNFTLIRGTTLPLPLRQHRSLGLDGQNNFVQRLEIIQEAHKLNAFGASDFIWLPPRDSNPDMLIQSQNSPTENTPLKANRSAKHGKSKQNTQTRRKR